MTFAFRFPLKGSVLALLAAAALELGTAQADARISAAFKVETQVTATPIIDYEFDQARSRFTFTDSQGNLWIGKVDPATGDFKPKNGQGLLVDTGTARSTDFGNGPEWAFGAPSPQLVYTKYVVGQTPSAANARIARAIVVNDVWVPGFIDATTPRTSPLGTQNSGDAIPRVCYDSPASLSGGQHTAFYVRNADGTGAEVVVPGSFGTLADATRRWVPGSHALVFSAAFMDTFGMLQIQSFMYDMDSATLQQLTFDPGAKKEVFIWQAPEFNNEYVMFTVVNGNEIRFYRKLDDGTGTLVWTPINRWFAPAAARIVWSPEPFVHNGKSYISFVLSPSNQIVDPAAPTIIAMVASDSTNITYLTDPSKKAVRADPEVFVTANGPYIYYNAYQLGTASAPGGSLGVYRLDTGLGAPQ